MRRAALEVEDIRKTFEEGSQRVEVLRGVSLDVSAGGRTGRLLLDSGAGITKLVSDSALVRDVPLAPGGHASGLAGEPQPFRLARGLEIGFGDFRVAVDARVVDEGHGQCGPDGILGLDALRQCVMVLSGDDLAIACGR